MQHIERVFILFIVDHIVDQSSKNLETILNYLV